MLGVEDGAVCTPCHAPDSKGYAAAAEMRKAIERLKEAFASADKELRRAEAVGMEMSDVRYEFRGADALLVKARTAAHHFSPGELNEAAATGLELAEKTRSAAAAALVEAWTRRRDLLIPLAVIAVLMILLVLRLRRLERGL
jgi:hypothetical protein